MSLEKGNPLYGALVRFKSAAKAYNKSNSTQSFNESALEHYCDLLARRSFIITPFINSSEGKLKQSKWALDGWIVDDFTSDGDDEEISISRTSISIIKCDFSKSDEVEIGYKKDVDANLKMAFNFLKLSCSQKAESGDTEESNEVRDLVNDRYNQNAILDFRIIYVSNKELNDGKLQSRLKDEKYGIAADVIYYDLKEYDQLTKSDLERLPLDIDLESEDFAGYNVNAISIKNDGSGAPNNYLAVVPADLIADLYGKYHSRILQSNVRLFLSTTRRANKAMLNTLKNNPNGFLAFNNGLSITCSKVETSSTGRITKLVDMQIVNGGQTTAVLSEARKTPISKETKDTISLKDVKVAVKITEIQKSNKSSLYEKVVSEISEAANTQTAVKKSDFLSNKAVFVDCEGHSKQLTANIEGSHYYYFFERMAGQYNAEKGRGTTKQKRVFENKHPKELSFDKIEFTRWHASMYTKFSHDIAKGAQKQFISYMDDSYVFQGQSIKFKGLSDSQFKWIVGYGLLFKRVRQLCGYSNGRIYSPAKGEGILLDTSVALATTIYAMGAIHSLTNGCLDYWSFFEGKHNLALACLRGRRTLTETDFDKDLKKVILHSYDLLQKKGGSSAQEEAKKNETRQFFFSEFKYKKEDLKELQKLMLTKQEVDQRLASSDKGISKLYEYFLLLKKLFGEESKDVRLLHYYSKQITGEKFVSGKNRSLISTYFSIAKNDKPGRTITIPDIKYLLGLKQDFEQKGYKFSKDKSMEFLPDNVQNYWNPNFDKVLSAFSGVMEEDFDDVVLEIAEDHKSQSDFLSLCEMFKANHFLSVSEISRLCDLLYAD